MKLENVNLNVATIDVEWSRPGNDWEKGTRSFPKSKTYHSVQKGRTYSVSIKNNRGGVWENVPYQVGSGLSHNEKGEEIHPTADDILISQYWDYSMMQNGHLDSFEDFCTDLGYDTDSIKALNNYLEVQKNVNKFKSLFTEEEIQTISELAEEY